MSIKKNKNQLIASIVVGVIIFLISYQFVIKQYEENAQQKEEIQKLKQGIGVNPDATLQTTVYVIATKEIAKGEVIKEDAVELKDLQIPMTNTNTKLEDVVGKTALKDIHEGKPVKFSAVDAPQPKKSKTGSAPKVGYRSVSGIVTDAKMGSFVKAGNYIDLYTANNSIQAKNIKVLKVVDQEKKAHKIVFFEIKEEDVGPFIYATIKDRLIPVQRNKEEDGFYEFSYDPFKYTSFTVSNSELKEIATNDEYMPPPPKVKNEYIVSKTKMEKLKEANTEIVTKTKEKDTVELIRGSSVKTVNFKKQTMEPKLQSKLEPQLEQEPQDEEESN